MLGQPERWAEIAKQLAAGENVVLLANHQTEADPGVFAHMLADAHPEMAENVIYVAGGCKAGGLGARGREQVGQGARAGKCTRVAGARGCSAGF